MAKNCCDRLWRNIGFENCRRCGQSLIIDNWHEELRRNGIRICNDCYDEVLAEFFDSTKKFVAGLLGLKI